MARKKRSTKLAKGAVAVRPAPVSEVAKVAAERFIIAFCPVCGHSIPEKRAKKIGYVTVDRVPYFESINWDANKPFGVSYSAAGRGSLRDWQYITPEEAGELFEAMKARFIQAIEEWIKKGWLEKGEILG